VVESTLPKLGN